MADDNRITSFFTILHNGEGRLTEKMSRFIAFARPANTPEQAKAIIKAIANEYCDARHVCWAYMVGPRRDTFLSSDDGEPSGTAGKPILGQINSFGLTDVVVVVVRYFGGIKLGTSGLIAAYREAAKLALDDAGKKEVQRTEKLVFRIDYCDFDKAMRIIKEKNITILRQEISMDCIIEIEINLSIFEEVKNRLTNIPSLTIV